MLSDDQPHNGAVGGGPLVDHRAHQWPTRSPAQVKA